MADEHTACRNVERGGGSICLGLQCDKVRYTYEGGEGNQ